MPNIQRYVSKELTHFVGGEKKTPEERYAVLTQILRSGWLTTNPIEPGSPKPLDMIPGRKISRNRMYYSHAICFCDIPVEDFGIHMAKYSPFGVAFQKSFLLAKGVNPVFYIANDSVLGKRVSDGKVTDDDVTRGEFFDYLSKGIYFRFSEGAQLLQNLPDLNPAVREYLLKYQKVDADCVHHLLAYLKPFHVTREDADPDNFYMEREWRSPDVQFALSDVWRVILPKDFATEFRRDFPDYVGQLTYAPDDIVPVDARAEQAADLDDEFGITMTIALAPKSGSERSSVTVSHGSLRREPVGSTQEGQTTPPKPLPGG